MSVTKYIPLYLCCSFGFLGTISAYGAGGGASYPHIRAGPGTIYINDKVLMGGASGHTLLVTGDLTDSSQEQTRTQLTGSGAADFDYDTVNITGWMWRQLCVSVGTWPLD